MSKVYKMYINGQWIGEKLEQIDIVNPAKD